MTLRFAHEQRARRVVFGAGRLAELPAEIDRLGARRVLLVTTPRGAGHARPLARSLEGRLAGRFDGAQVHVPVAVARAATEQARELGADLLLAFGGGSAIGVAKAVALETGLRIAAVPTTCSGSEMTGIWGVTEPGTKKTGRDPVVAPRLVVYDPLLTLDLPPRVSAASGMNAIAHAVEALWASEPDPVASLLSEAAIEALGRALPLVVRTPGDAEARGEALRGAYFAGWALDLVRVGLQHRLAHLLGGRFELPHAELHAVLLPHVVAWNQEAAAAPLARVARALGAGEQEAAQALDRLLRTLGLGGGLRGLGVPAEALEEVVRAVREHPPPNPRPIEAEGVRALLEAAWEGRPPRA